MIYSIDCPNPQCREQDCINVNATVFEDFDGINITLRNTGDCSKCGYDPLNFVTREHIIGKIVSQHLEEN